MVKRKIKGKSYTCLNCGSVWEPGDEDYHRAKGMLTASLHERCPKCLIDKVLRRIYTGETDE